MNDEYNTLSSAIHDGDKTAGVQEALKLVQSGKKVPQIFIECIEPTLTEVGEQFSRLDIFLPELMNSGSTVKAIQEALLPYLEGEGTGSQKGKIVICTVSGDLHDIGKNIVKTMLEVNGFELRDLGVDVSATNVVKAAAEFNADIIALSALMLPSLPSMKDVIDILRENEKYNGRFKVMVGGGPVSQEWAQKAGADAYGDNAIEAVKVAHALYGGK
jgi:5-methyltetrahydrofolate--homocysteine methyltransferase